MKDQEAEENNKLIAEFMEWKFIDNEYITTHYKTYICIDKNIHITKRYSLTELEFHRSWDWLMPVVEKCTQIGFRDQEFDSEIYIKWEEIFDDTGMFLGNHINEVYESCIAFIKWYKNNTECSNCEGTGEVYFSCCGDDIRHQLPEDDLCPTCKEHCGDESEKCEECNGTGEK